MALQRNGTGAQIERRRSRRYAFDAPLEIEWGSAVLQGRVRDIGGEGMFIELSEPLWLGASFSARLALDDPVWLSCVVRRVEPGRGMGVSFIANDEARTRIALLLQMLARK